MNGAALKIDAREAIREAECDFCRSVGMVGLSRDGVIMCVACLGDNSDDAEEQARIDAAADSATARAEYERAAMVRP